MLSEVVDNLGLLAALYLGGDIGGWTRPNSGSSPPFELKWLEITKIFLPLNMNSPANGLRLKSNAVFVGSMRPG